MLNQLVFLDAACKLGMTAMWHPGDAQGEMPLVPEVPGGISVLLQGVTWQLHQLQKGLLYMAHTLALVGQKPFN